jgi:hypothetical protein
LFISIELPEFNFPSLEPLFYDIHHAKYNNADIHADVAVTDIITIGLENTTFVSTKTHFADNVFRLENNFNILMLLNKGRIKIVGSVGPLMINNTGAEFY